MVRIARIFLTLMLVLVGLAAIVITFTIGWRPFIGPQAHPLAGRTFDRTPKRLERGRYIATALSGCIDCHSPHDWNAPGTPYVPGMEGAGELMPGRISPVASSLPISLPIPKPVSAAGPTINLPVPFAKASATTAVPFFP
jgi:hypothetical protein